MGWIWHQGIQPSLGFGDWIQAVKDSNAHYQRLDQSHGVIDVGDPDITVDVIGPVLESDGHSLVFRITYNFIRTFFSGDLNEEGSEHILAVPNAPLAVNAHVFKTPHHGSQIQHRTFQCGKTYGYGGVFR